MILVAGLGNPGSRYAHTRHNAGFMAVDRIAACHDFGPERHRFGSLVREGMLAAPCGSRRKVLLVKPQTFMNRSGHAVAQAARYYKTMVEDIIVFHDELDLAPGRFRMKTGGGAAGHNGIRSVDTHVGNGFKRARIGIGHPGHREQVDTYVLGDFAKTEKDLLLPLLEALAMSLPFVLDNDSRYASAVHAALGPRGHSGRRRALPDDAAPSGKPPA